ncbi:YfhO family protein [Lacticaseibacillus saniviri]
MKKQRGALAPWLITSLIVAVMYFVLSWRAGTNQLVGGSILSGDLSQQYLSFFQYYRHVLFGGFDQMGYSLSNGMGGLMAGNWAYYLLSPFNLITLIFPATHLPEALYVLIWLKISLAGGAMTWLLQKWLPKLHTSYAVALGISYGLMSFILNYQSNLMWLDGIMLLPIVMWTMLQLLRGKSWVPYTLILTLVMICNYYMGYMIAAFLVLYFILYSIDEFRDWPDFVARGLRFAGASLLSGLMSAVVLVPLVLDITANKSNIHTSVSDMLHQMTRIRPLIPAQLISGQVDPRVPSIFVGTLVVIAALGYFFNRTEKLKTRLLSLALLLIFVASTLMTSLYLFWHGFQEPQSYPYRFIYLMSFWLIVLAARQLASGQWTKRQWQSIGIVLAIFLVYDIWIRHAANLSLGRLAMATVLALALAWLINASRRWPQLRYVIVALVCLEVGYGGTRALQNTHGVAGDSYRTYMKTMTDVLGKATAKTDYGRLEKTFMRGGDRGDSYTYRYQGISAFSSNNDPELADLLSYMGIPAYGYFEAYFGGTQLTDSLFGIRTIVDTTRKTNAKQDFYHYGSREDVHDWPVVAKSGTFTAYRNPNALPLGFASPKHFEMPNFSYVAMLDDQTWLLNNVSGTKRVYFDLLKPHVSYKNARINQSGQYYFLRKKNKHKAASITITYPVKKGVPVYVTVGQQFLDSATISIDGKKVNPYKEATKPTPLGVTPKHKTLKVKITMHDAVIPYKTLQANQLDQKMLKQTMTQLKRGGWQLNTLTSNHISGTITTKKNQRLLTTIPYTSGWTATVDGKPARVYRGIGRFLAVDLTPGKHTVAMRFKTPGLRIGALISLIGVALLVGIKWWSRDQYRHAK